MEAEKRYTSYLEQLWTMHSKFQEKKYDIIFKGVYSNSQPSIHLSIGPSLHQPTIEQRATRNE